MVCCEEQQAVTTPEEKKQYLCSIFSSFEYAERCEETDNGQPIDNSDNGLRREEALTAKTLNLMCIV